MICFIAVKAMFGETDGLVDGLSAGKIWVDHSTTDFGQTFEFEKAVRRQTVYGESETTTFVVILLI